MKQNSPQKCFRSRSTDDNTEDSEKTLALMLQTMDIHERTTGVGVDLGGKIFQTKSPISDLDLIRSSFHLVHEAKSGIFVGVWHAFARQTKNKEPS